MNYKRDCYLSLIPYVGFLIILFTGFIRIKKKSLLKAIVYFFSSYIFLFVSMLLFIFPVRYWLFNQTETIILIFGALIMYLWLLLPSIALVGLQKKFLR